jgi:hypothetical protein
MRRIGIMELIRQSHKYYELHNSYASHMLMTILSHDSKPKYESNRSQSINKRDGHEI